MGQDSRNLCIVGLADLLQLRVLGFGYFQYGNVLVGVFPKVEKILVGGASLGDFALHCEGSSDLKMRECANGFVQYDSAMVKDLLELDGASVPLRSAKYAIPRKYGGYMLVENGNCAPNS
jgi:hypothetical protein